MCKSYLDRESQRQSSRYHCWGFYVSRSNGGRCGRHDLERVREAVFGRVGELHGDIHTSAYRAQPSRRVHIPKADGKLRPLGIAAFEDEVVQQAIATTTLGAIYKADFLGFPYGF